MATMSIPTEQAKNIRYEILRRLGVSPDCVLDGGMSFNSDGRVSIASTSLPPNWKRSLTVASPTWLAKLKRYGGGESVMSSHSTHLAAQEVVHDWNTRYQSDMAYVELWEEHKNEWPSG